jgi:hypothetical protein
LRVTRVGVAATLRISNPCLSQTDDISIRQEASMAQYGSGGNGNIRQLYGVIIRDRIKSASLETLQAYRVVANDLLKSNEGDDGELRASLADLDKAIAAKK